MKTIILRHDFDHADGLDEGVKLLFDIERKYNVYSTTFLRYDRGVSDLKYKSFYQDMEAQGWEFGLHLANHENIRGYDSPATELETVRKLGINILGVAACGGTYNWKDPNGWIVQDSLGLKYICPSSLPIPEGYAMKTLLAPNHITLDGTYLFRYGEAGLDICIKDFIQYISNKDALALLAHNTWFYNDVTPSNSNKRVRNAKYFDEFIAHFKSLPDEYEFKTYKEYLNI